MRISNVLTTVSNILMGFFLAAGCWQPYWVLGMLIAASVCFYLSGMVLNDLFDLKRDQVQRPERPLPSGRVPVHHARLIGFGLLLGGLALAFLVSATNPAESPSDNGRTAKIAICLAVCILAYDGGFKTTIAGPFVMGLCRFFNVLLGCSIASLKPSFFFGLDWHFLWVASGIGLYVAGITWFAKAEHQRSQRAHLALSALVMAAGIGWLGYIFSTRLNQPVASQWAGLLFLFIMVPVIRRVVMAIANPTPARVQQTVVVSLLTLIMIDAAICYLTAPHQPFYGLAIALLVVPTYWLGRTIHPT